MFCFKGRCKIRWICLRKINFYVKNKCGVIYLMLVRLMGWPGALISLRLWTNRLIRLQCANRSVKGSIRYRYLWREHDAVKISCMPQWGTARTRKYISYNVHVSKLHVCSLNPKDIQHGSLDHIPPPDGDVCIYFLCHSPPITAEVKNTWRYTWTPPYVLTVLCLIKKRLFLHGFVLR
jgi:hypothetical protein